MPPAMHLGLAFDLQTDPSDERQAEFDPQSTIDALRQALEAQGHHVSLVGNASALLQGPARCCDVDLIFNIAEGAHGRCREAWAPMLLELYHIPYVGSDALALGLALDKVMMKRLAVADGVPTPRWISIDDPALLPKALSFGFPVIVKPRWEGSGRGINQHAVVHTPEALRQRVQWLYNRVQQPILIEEFIAGGELTVCIIGNTPPVVYPAIQRPLDPATTLSYHVVKPSPATWVAPLILEPLLDQQACEIARTMFDAIGCRDMARVDLRVDAHGRVQFLEINPLPSFDPEGSLGLLAESLGVTYDEMIGSILDAALGRFGYPSRHRSTDAPMALSGHTNS
ncbi:MAG: ATP-grasp domain-containing protein [Candidatus Omnitrophica bacterium]|nr:ATP-grasp domain-containing protein [Candidatus Omnitrophota bacterium]